MKMSIITLNGPLQSLSVNGLGGPNTSMRDQILQAIAEIFYSPRLNNYYGFLEIFGPEDRIFQGTI